MEHNKNSSPLRPYQAIIWDSDPDSGVIRATYFAISAEDAKKKAVEEHGEGFMMSIWNEEDAEKPR